jgi:multiple sugar transport system permease protein
MLVLRRIWKRNWVGYLFLLPWLIGLIGLNAVPMATSLYLSFTNYDLFSSPGWIGLDNYSAMAEDTQFKNAVSVTAKYVLIGVPLQLSFALSVALLLNRGLGGLRIYRAIFYIPSLFAGSVAIAMLWRDLFGGEGLVNKILNIFGIEGMNWISTPSTSIYTLIVLLVWQFGSSMVIFLAGLQQIPQELYEASRIDGAGRVRQFLNVTFPMLTPVIFFNLIMNIISAFQAFTPAYIVSGGTGGPLDSTLFYTLYLYQKGFSFFQMGYASAMAWVLLVSIAVITALIFASSKKWVFYND